MGWGSPYCRDYYYNTPKQNLYMIYDIFNCNWVDTWWQ